MAVDREDYLRELLREGFLIHPSALEVAIESGITLSQLKSIALKSGSRYIKEEMLRSMRAAVEGKAVKKPEKARGDVEHAVEVLMDASTSMGTRGAVEDFSALFNDRFRRLAPLVKRRLKWAYSIADVRNRSGQEVRIIGMVSDCRVTRNGFYRITMEDTSGEITVIAGPDMLMGETVLPDEVIGVVGEVSRRGDDVIFAREIVWPEVDPIPSPRGADAPVDAVIISDVHVGSREFLAERFERFIAWLKSEEASRVRYLLIAGDLVDGVGVYPGQENELEITSVYEQYERLSRYLEEIPERIKVIVIPGNHDFTRPHEPQPGFPEEVRKILPPDTMVLSNPSLIRLHGVTFLLYHGTSLNDMVEAIPGADYSRIENAMIGLLRRRHLAPIYGGKVPLAPLPRDYLVVEEVPQFFVTGHVHSYAYARWKGVHLINASTWQAQTAYQKMLNFQPDPCVATVVHLDALTVEEMRF